MPEEKHSKIKEKLQEIFPIKINEIKDENKSKRKMENIVVLLIILIITVILINMIWNSNGNNKKKDVSDESKTLAKEKQTSNNENEINLSLETKLENILQNIDGVGNVKVLLTYSESSKTLAMYNEDISNSDTEETDSRAVEIEKFHKIRIKKR